MYVTTHLSSVGMYAIVIAWQIMIYKSKVYTANPQVVYKVHTKQVKPSLKAK